MLSGVGGTVNGNVTFDQNGRLIIRQGEWALDLHAKESKKVNLQVWMVTPLGQQIFSLLPAPNIEANLRYLAARLDQSDVDQVMLFKLGKSLGGDNYEVRFQEDLKKQGLEQAEGEPSGS